MPLGICATIICMPDMKAWFGSGKKTLALMIVLVLLLAAWAYVHFFTLDLSSVLRSPLSPGSSGMVHTTSPLSRIKHVFVIVEENHDWSAIYKNPDAPYLNDTLLPMGAYAKDYHNVAPALDELHPSEPNYILLESGMIAFPDHTFTTDGEPSRVNSTSSRNHLSTLLEHNNYSWRAYEEDISGNDCPIAVSGNYAPKHNPFIYFHDVSGNPPSEHNAYCRTHIRPLGELTHDLASGTVANYTFITPDLQHDMHDGTVAEADTWLSHIVPEILNATAYKQDGALFIIWDEGSELINQNAPIGMVILSPYVNAGYSDAQSYSHASFIKTVQEIFAVSPLLGYAGDPTTRDLSGFFR